MNKKRSNNLYPPWRLIFGQVPYDIVFVIGQIQRWGLEQYLIFFFFFLPYLLIVISWFIRQRKEEEIIDSLLKDLNFDTLEALKTFLGDLKVKTKGSKRSPSKSKTSIGKKASSTGKKANKKRGKKHEHWIPQKVVMNDTLKNIHYYFFIIINSHRNSFLMMSFINIFYYHSLHYLINFYPFSLIKAYPPNPQPPL